MIRTEEIDNWHKKDLGGKTIHQYGATEHRMKQPYYSATRKFIQNWQPVNVLEGHGTHAWKLPTDKEQLTGDAISIVFLGTGSAPIVGEHQYYADGDNLTKFAIDESDTKPTLLVKGISTSNMREDEPERYLDNIESGTAGSAISTASGSGMKTRLSLALNEFLVPELFKIAALQIERKGALTDPIKINIAGHSRGAITAIAMTELVAEYFRNFSKVNENDINWEALAKQTGLEESVLRQCFKPLQAQCDLSNEHHAQVKLVAYDPVEGSVAPYDSQNYGIPIFTDKKIKGIPVSSQNKTNLNIETNRIGNVTKEAQIVYALHERRQAFRPTRPKVDSEKTKLQDVYVPGGHATMTGSAGDCDGRGQFGASFESLKDIEGQTNYTKIYVQTIFDLTHARTKAFLDCDAPPFLDTMNRTLNEYQQVMGERLPSVDNLAKLIASDPHWENKEIDAYNCIAYLREHANVAKQFTIELCEDLRELQIGIRSIAEQNIKKWEQEIATDTSLKGTKFALALDKANEGRWLYQQRTGKWLQKADTGLDSIENDTMRQFIDYKIKDPSKVTILNNKKGEGFTIQYDQTGDPGIGGIGPENIYEIEVKNNEAVLFWTMMQQKFPEHDFVKQLSRSKGEVLHRRPVMVMTKDKLDTLTPSQRCGVLFELAEQRMSAVMLMLRGEVEQDKLASLTQKSKAEFKQIATKLGVLAKSKVLDQNEINQVKAMLALVEIYSVALGYITEDNSWGKTVRNYTGSVDQDIKQEKVEVMARLLNCIHDNTNGKVVNIEAVNHFIEKTNMAEKMNEHQSRMSSWNPMHAPKSATTLKQIEKHLQAHLSAVNQLMKTGISNTKVE